MTGAALSAGAAAGFFASFFGLRASFFAFMLPLAMIRSLVAGNRNETRLFAFGKRPVEGSRCMPGTPP
jgi:hypothetical protein